MSHCNNKITMTTWYSTIFYQHRAVSTTVLFCNLLIHRKIFISFRENVDPSWFLSMLMLTNVILLTMVTESYISRSSYGMSIVGILQKSDRVMTVNALYFCWLGDRELRMFMLQQQRYYLIPWQLRSPGALYEFVFRGFAPYTLWSAGGYCCSGDDKSA